MEQDRGLGIQHSYHIYISMLSYIYGNPILDLVRAMYVDAR